jgi:pimeloyl-ACP methyl ester carboxylesterase
MVDIGGTRLHIYCAGEGSPPVIFESGMSDSGYTWATILQQTAEKTRTCLYDRPGLGWSDPNEQLFFTEDVAKNLNILLENAGITPPYILVGHSIGGVYIRSFYNQHPEKVVGMVFVDSTHENEATFYQKSEEEENSAYKTMLNLCELIASLGILRLTGVMGSLLEDSNLPPRVQRAAVSRLNRVSYCQGVRREKESSDIDVSQTEPPDPLGDLPLIVISGAKALNPVRNRFYIGPVPPRQRKNTVVWQEIQKDLTDLSSNSKQVLAYRSGHYIHWDQPALVISAIDEMLKQVAGK